MSLQDILSISGYSGLFRHVSQTKNGIIVESLTDKKRMPAYASSKISALEDIALFTYEDDMPLIKVFEKIYNKEHGAAISHKSSADELKKYFAEVLPEYDKERVYVSDIKKVIQWYNILNEQGMLEFNEDEKENEDSEEVIDESSKSDE